MPRFSPRPLATVGLLTLVCSLGAIACTEVESPSDGSTPPSAETAPAPTMPEVAPGSGIVLDTIAGPDGGLVQQLTIPGPESAALVTCDQEGFVPFSFTDMGLDWVGCQVPNPGDTVGAASSLTEPTLAQVASPVGGMVPQVTIPGPQSAVVITCGEGFKPFVYEDQGTWVGCQAP